MQQQRRLPRPKSGIDPAFPRLLGERLCLDFANTIEAPLHAPEDFLESYPDLVRWGRHTALLTDTEAEGLLAEASRRPTEAAEVFARAIALRGAIRRSFLAIATESLPKAVDLAAIQQVHLAGLARAHIAASGDRFAWEWDDAEVVGNLDRLLWPIARSAVELLTTGDLMRVKLCAGPEGCGWLFYDTSKNDSRRWCSMEGCGSRAKMRRYNARRRSARG